jgi:uncharacterized 2Fe-2S/4Fe-4S cluster protein (DUF4445 family)
MKLTLSTGEEYQLKERESLFEALKRLEQYIVSPCGGKGICGKCAIKILDGKYKAESYGKLSKDEIKAGLTLACQTVPKTDVKIEIPQTSRLIVGDRIAIGRSRELFELLTTMGARPSSLVKRKQIKLPPPTIDDHASDLERLKRSLDNAGLKLMFSKDFVHGIADELRKNNWDITLC